MRGQKGIEEEWKKVNEMFFENCPELTTDHYVKDKSQAKLKDRYDAMRKEILEVMKVTLNIVN